MSKLNAEHAEMKIDTDETVTVSAANTDYSINGSDVVKGEKRYALQDPDAGANPDMKLRLGPGRWLVEAHGRLTATSAVCQAHLTTQARNAAAATDEAIDATPSGGGPFHVSEILDLDSPGYTDVELLVSNETNTNNITVSAGTRLRAIALESKEPREVR